MADLIPYEHIDFSVKRKIQLSNLGISHSMLISIQVKNYLYSFSKSFIATIYIVIVYYPRKLHEQSLFRSLVEKISLNVPGQRDCIIGSKNPLKIDANASKERSLLEIPFAVCSGRNKKFNETK